MSIVGGDRASLRVLPDMAGIGEARTLPAACYADASFHERERRAVFHRTWVCAGVIDDLPADGSWQARTVGGMPVLLVRDREGVLRAFLNVCRHRAAPLCDDSGEGALIRCPYHSWLYRLDGSLARAAGVGDPDGFALENHALRPVGVRLWRRLVFVHLSDPRADFDLGPLAAAVDAWPIEDMVAISSEADERRFNWKVLLENYSENYHTPFVHPEIDTSSTEDYPIVTDGLVAYAWDRVLRPETDDEVIRATRLPGEPGWERLFTTPTGRPYDVGSYLTIWPNAMINAFPDAALVMWVEPMGPGTTMVHRRLYVGQSCDPATIDAIVAAHRLVHDQDIDICARVQRSHDAGIDADGVLATTEERGVHFLHQHLQAALAAASAGAPLTDALELGG